jgi:hypothetical protein
MFRVKILFITVVSLMFIIPLQGAKQKTGEIRNDVLNDLQLGYSLNIPKNWKAKIFDEPSVTRVFLSKRNYEVNRDVKALGGDYTVPEIYIYSRPDTISPKDFLERLKAQVQSHQSTDDIINKLNIILTGEYVTIQETKLGDIPVIQALFKRNYTRELQGDPADPRYRQFGGRIARNEHDVHEYYIFKLGQNLYVIQAYAEREFYPSNKDEFAKIISSLKFTSIADSAKTPSDGKSK